MDSDFKCNFCNIPISKLRLDFGNSLEEVSQEFCRLESLYSRSVSFNSSLVCKCKKYFCFHCSWQHFGDTTAYHTFESNNFDSDAPGAMNSLELARKLYLSIGRVRNTKTIALQRKISEYQNQRVNSFFDEVNCSICLLMFVLDFISENNIDTATDDYLLELGKLHFVSGNSAKALEVLAPLCSSCPESKLKYWILILNYIGPKYYRNNLLLEEIKDTISLITVPSFEEIRLRALTDYLTKDNQYLNPFEYYENYFRGPSENCAEKYYSLLDIARYDMSKDKLQHIQRLIHFTNVYFQSSIYLSNSYKLLSAYYKKSGNYERALYFLELSTESYIKTTPKNSPDIIVLLSNSLLLGPSIYYFMQ